jgi:hypothetical protein
MQASDHATRWRQHPPFIHQLGKLDLAPPSPRILRTRHDYNLVIKQRFELKPLVDGGAPSRCDQEIDVTLTQFAMQRLRISGDEVKHDSRILLRKPLDHGRNKASSENVTASNSHFSSSGIGERLDALYGLTEFIEHSSSAIEQNTTVLGHLDEALGVAVEQSHANSPFQLRDRPGNSGLGGVEEHGGLAHVAGLHHGH